MWKVEKALAIWTLNHFSSLHVLRPQQQEGKTILNKPIKLDGLTMSDLQMISMFWVFQFLNCFRRGLLYISSSNLLLTQKFVGPCNKSSNIWFFPWNAGNFPPELQASPCWATKSLRHRRGSYRQGNIRGAIFCKAYIIRSCKGSSSDILTVPTWMVDFDGKWR